MIEKKQFHLYTDDDKFEIIQDYLNNRISIRSELSSEISLTLITTCVFVYGDIRNP